ncbi:MAG: TorD/DmsD family molecular chaperone [Anaerolineales bacterium]
MEQANFNTWKTTLTGEVLLFGLLGKILYQDLDKAWLETLIHEDVFAEVPFGAEQTEVNRGLELLSRWSKENQDGISTQEFKGLKQDQLRLFIGTDRVLAPVWESVYFSEKHLVFQEQTMLVREWFSRFGLQAECLNREPDDHIGLEFSFIAHLASLAIQAIDLEDNEVFEEKLQAQRDFLFEHLLRWGPSWARLVKQYAETDFYRGLAHLSHGALLAAAEHLKIELPKEVSL